MKSPERLLLVAGCFLSLGVGGGCGGSDVEPLEEAKPAKPSAEARRQLKDPKSPASVAIDFWKSVQGGALPLSIQRYDPKVVKAIGIAAFAGMLPGQQPQIKASSLSILRLEEVGGGRLVWAEALPERGPKVGHSFFLRRRNGRWVIAYDTLSATALQTYVQTRAAAQATGSSRQVAARAARAAAEATDTYREAGLSPEPRPRRVQRPNARTPAAAAPSPPAALPSPADAGQTP